jgi:hypothetical protein
VAIALTMGPAFFGQQRSASGAKAKRAVKVVRQAPRFVDDAQCLVSRTGLAGAFRLTDPIATRVDFSGCMIPVMASAEQQRESLNIRLLVDSIPVLIHTARPDGCIDYFNRPGLDYLGATLDDVTGWKWTAFV